MHLIKEFPGNVKAVFLVFRHEHLSYPATAHLGKFEHFTDYMMSCLCGYVQLQGYFFNSYPPFSKNQVIYCLLFSRCFTSEGLPCLGSSLILVRPSLNFLIHLYTFLWFKQLLPYWADILLNTSLGFTPLQQEIWSQLSVLHVSHPPREKPSKKLT